MIVMTTLRHFVAIVFVAAAVGSASAAGDPVRGAKVFGACAACHSLETDQHLTGPSLAGIWDRKAGSLESFPRFSEALKRSGVAWNEQTLNALLSNPAVFIPGNQMTFQGLPDARLRSDLIAFLKATSEGKAPKVASGGGMMSPPQLSDLKNVSAKAQVAAIRHCGDSYFVTTVAGDKVAFWERNLRFTTDSSKRGPAPSRPVIIPSGMMGDRAMMVFSNPGEISGFIRNDCQER
jgi:cytochrome c